MARDGAVVRPRRTAKLPAIQVEEKPHYHDHRACLRTRFDAVGADALADYELLELMLVRTIPRRHNAARAPAYCRACCLGQWPGPCPRAAAEFAALP